MRVFSVPVSAPFLRTVIAALVDGRLIDGFKPGARPADLAQGGRRPRSAPHHVREQGHPHRHHAPIVRQPFHGRVQKLPLLAVR